jgi:hypothetical protein
MLLFCKQLLSISRAITSKLSAYVISFSTGNLSYVSVLFCIDMHLVLLMLLIVSLYTFHLSWINATLYPQQKQ